MANIYQSNHATFELPAQLKDKTMHMFTLSDDGPSDFSMVISHADTQPGEQLEDFGARLVSEMGRALPRFQLRHMKDCVLDASPATELAYSWRNDGNFMHQRQVVCLVQGAVGDSVQAIMIAATCLKPFTDEWNAAFDAVLASFKLRRPLTTLPAAPVVIPDIVNPSGLPIVFAYSERRRMLQVFANADEACRTDGREVEQEAWAFFDADGEPLMPAFDPTNASTWGKPPTYSLVPSARPAAPRLRDHLHHVGVLHTTHAAPQLSTVAEIRQHLARAIAKQAA